MLKYIPSVTCVVGSFYYKMFSLVLFCSTEFTDFLCSVNMTFIDLNVESSRMSPLHHGERASYVLLELLSAVRMRISASELIRDIGLWEHLTTEPPLRLPVGLSIICLSSLTSFFTICLFRFSVSSVNFW